MDMRKVLWCRFQQCLGTFTMLFVEEMSETGLFRNLSGRVSGVCNFGKSKSMRVIFFPKYLKFIAAFRIPAKDSEKIFCFWDNFIWISIFKLSLLRTGYFSSKSFFKKQSLDLAYQKQRLPSTQLRWQFSMNMIEMLRWRFQQWFEAFTMLLVEGCSQRKLFRHWYDHIFGVRNSKIKKSMSNVFVLKMVKI